MVSSLPMLTAYRPNPRLVQLVENLQMSMLKCLYVQVTLQKERKEETSYCNTKGVKIEDSEYVCTIAIELELGKLEVKNSSESW